MKDSNNNYIYDEEKIKKKVPKSKNSDIFLYEFLKKYSLTIQDHEKLLNYTKNMENKFSEYFSNYFAWFLLKLLPKFLGHISSCPVLYSSPKSLYILYSDSNSELLIYDGRINFFSSSSGVIQLSFILLKFNFF